MFEHKINDVCAIKEFGARPGMPEWANLTGAATVTLQSADNLFGGGGVYACFWDGNLIYIGSFIGKDGDTHGGHVADRIYKHVIGFTLRAQNLRFSPGALKSILNFLDHDIAGDLAAALKEGAYIKDGSIAASFNKARFASRHWESIRDASPAALLGRFSFGYMRYGPNLPQDKGTARRIIKPIEKALIQEFEPICNTQYRAGDDGPAAGIDEVRASFEKAFARTADCPEATGFDEVLSVPISRDDHDDEVEKDHQLPQDDRWLEYTTPDGQLRARVGSDQDDRLAGRVLLVRTSGRSVSCFAAAGRLAGLDIESRSLNSQPLQAAVAIDWRADDDEARMKKLRVILEASFAELQALEN